MYRKLAQTVITLSVSWQVTGVRHDPYAAQHPMQTEQVKSPADQGRYLHPELYGQPDSKRIGSEFAAHRPELVSRQDAEK